MVFVPLCAQYCSGYVSHVCSSVIILIVSSPRQSIIGHLSLFYILRKTQHGKLYRTFHYLPFPLYVLIQSDSHSLLLDYYQFYFVVVEKTNTSLFHIIIYQVLGRINECSISIFFSRWFHSFAEHFSPMPLGTIDKPLFVCFRMIIGNSVNCSTVVLSDKHRLKPSDHILHVLVHRIFRIRVYKIIKRTIFN